MNKAIETFLVMFFATMVTVLGFLSFIHLGNVAFGEEAKEPVQISACLDMDGVKAVAKDLKRIMDITWMMGPDKQKEGFTLFLFTEGTFYNDKAVGLMVVFQNGCAIHSEVVNVGQFRDA